MARELILRKCKSCGAMVKVIQDCHSDECGIRCCGEQMNVVLPNSVDAAVEKHVPEYKVEGDKILVKVNHVMEEDHYIEWISMVSDKQECTKYFKPGEVAETKFHYIPGSTLYAYCNKHSLWKKDVE